MTRPLDTRLQDADVLVLGATGFIGRWVAAAAEAAGARVVLAARDGAALDRVADLHELAGARRIVDVGRAGELEGLVSECSPDVVFNLAGYGVDRGETDEAVAERINADLPPRLVEAVAAVESPWPGTRVMHVGSALEYGAASGDLDEATTALPTTTYGITKLAGTRGLVRRAEELGVTGLTARLFTVYGAGEHGGRLLPTLLDAARGAGPVRLSAGLQQRDFAWVVDVADTLIGLSVLPGVPGSVVNVATGVSTPVREFAERAARVLGIAPSRLEFGTEPVRAEEMDHEPVSTARLRALIGGVVPDRIEHGIAETRRFLDGAIDE